MAVASQKILTKMLERLFASMASGPSLNARPHASRQRLDFTQLSKLQDDSPGGMLTTLLSQRTLKAVGRVPLPPGGSGERSIRKRGRKSDVAPDADTYAIEPESLTPEERLARQRWLDQSTLMRKLRGIIEDARTYEQDTGVHVLNIGFPLLQLPPGAVGGGGRSVGTRWVVAPLAFIPVTLTIESGTAPTIKIECHADEQDLVVPNTALLAWLEQQTGKPLPEMFSDESGEDPWREICEIVRHIAQTLGIQTPNVFDNSADAAAEKPSVTSEPHTPGETVEEKTIPVAIEGEAKPNETAIPATDQPPAEEFVKETLGSKKARTGTAPSIELTPAPRPDDAEPRPMILTSAVIGLFPMSNQGLLRDTQAMLGGEEVVGPIESFVRAGVELDRPAEATPPAEHARTRTRRNIPGERPVAHSDPCQARAVALARDSAGLVIHGPPGTGKSQTITNIIGDHLARGQRVLVVCDKRTALDVVFNRLDHMGLGKLCAIVHDPQRDQRELYRAIREQIETLPEETSDEKAEKKLAKLDAELVEIHAELTRYHEGLWKTDAEQGLNFHELVGRWLGTGEIAHVQFDATLAASISPALLEASTPALQEILARSLACSYATNPWKSAVGISLAEFLAEPLAHFRTRLSEVKKSWDAVDLAIEAGIAVAFSPQIDLKQQADARMQLAGELRAQSGRFDPEILKNWVGTDVVKLQRIRQRVTELDSFIQTFRQGVLDGELLLAHGDSKPTMAQIGLEMSMLNDYVTSASSVFGFFAFSKKSAARKILARYALPLSAESAQRVKGFIAGLRARRVLAEYHASLTGRPISELPDDATLQSATIELPRLFDLLLRVASDPALTGLSPAVAKFLLEPGDDLPQRLEQSHARAKHILNAQTMSLSAKMFAPKWIQNIYRSACAGEGTGMKLTALVESFGTIENILRVGESRASIADALRPALDALVAQSVDAPTAITLLTRHVFAAEIGRRLKADPNLQQLDRERLQGSFDRYRKLDSDKRQLVRDVILHQWLTKQKDRLLAATGSRLNTLGADMRRRLTMRGERAMRLRQVVSVGEKIEGGDPLFDLRPIWMASPETVAQVFPRKGLFDVVVFDEASQCRLEEALPVLIRGRRVVIAGDPKQLPPTRFFESALFTTEDVDPETDQDLFEQQQGEIEDLLSAALSLAIEQCYLDVHYRSRNGDLIEFSNEHFYGSRLQAIPGHPSNRSKTAPVRIERVEGVYKESTNDAEAARVVQIVRDLLKRATPPSIGIACFNIQQRDLILEKLDDAGAEDASFGKKLAEARARRGEGSFEGLFVKNLENVQGDERDHLIISTTYGPDEKGRFYRRFGPLGRAGGGRRLNVLVTRARHEVHLVTSIPAEAYRSLPPVPPDQAPGGGWLLFSYLKFAESLGEQYAAVERNLEVTEVQSAVVNVRPTRAPSTVAASLANQLAEHHAVGSDVHWGNEGFCVDLALHHPQHADDVTLGVLCDTTRFKGADDPVEWDVFRTGILQQQGWALHRLWSPHFVRDPDSHTQEILAKASKIAETRTAERDVIRTKKSSE